MGPGQVRALADLGPRYLLPYVAMPFDFGANFGREAPRVFEIGFGMGDATAQIAEALPGTDFIGVEVHTPGVGALLKQIGERGLDNLRLIQHDAVDVLQQMIAPASLAGVHIFFSRSLAQEEAQQAAAGAGRVRAPAGESDQAGGLFALRDRLAALCRANARGVGCGAHAAQYR